MIRRLILLGVVLALSAPAVIFAQNPDPAPGHNISRGLRGRFVIVPSITGGLLTGDGGDYFGDTKDKTFYGFGLGLEYYIRPHYAIGGRFAAVWKDMSRFDVNAVRMFNYAAYGLFRLSPYSDQSPYAQVAVGLMTGSVSEFDSRLDLGSYAYFRLGIGLYTFTGAKTNTRFELYYKNIRTEGHELPYPYPFIPAKIPINLEGIGAEMAVGVPL